MTVTFGNAKKQISYEEMGTAFLGLMESEYKDIEQARAAEEQEEETAENATSGHNVQKLETEPKKTAETELAFQIADRFISIQETDSGYDYSIMGADYKEIDGGVYDNPNVSIREALNDIVEDLKENPFDNGAISPKGRKQKRAGTSCGKGFLKSPPCREKGTCFRSGERP